MKANQFKTMRSWIILILLFITAGISLPVQAANKDLFVGYGDSVLRYDGVTGIFLGTFIAGGSGGVQNIQCLTIGPDGNFYVSSWDNGSIKRYNGTTGAFIDDFVPSGSGGLSNPDQVVFGPDGNLYVSDRFRASILRYNGTTGAFIDTFISDERLGGFVGFTFGPDGNIYASMFNGAQRILRFNGITGAFMDAFAEGLPPADSAYAGLVFGPDGYLYASRYHANRIERFNPQTGAFVDLFVPTSSGGLYIPDYLTFGPDGNLYVNSLNTHSVLRYDGKTGAFIDVFASVGGSLFPKGLVFASGAPLNIFDGFYAPVDNPPFINLANAGQTIPLKWRTTDLYGNPVTDLGNVKVTVSTLACSFGTTSNQIEDYTTGNSGLQNLGNGYYQWNWKVPSKYAGSCKTLNLDLGDGSMHKALFQLFSRQPKHHNR